MFDISGPCTPSHPPKRQAKHHFKYISVQCYFGCKGPGYKTYSRLHEHYLDFHNTCLHKVARFDPDNMQNFPTQVADVLEEMSIPRETTFRFDSSNLGQNYLPNYPSLYPAPIPTGSTYRNYSLDARPQAFSGIGPSRFPIVHPTTRHQPYPQSRPQRQGSSYTEYPPAHYHANGTSPLTTTGRGLPTPDTPSPGTTWQEYIPHNEGYVQSPFRSSTVSRSSGSPQMATGTSTPAQLAQVPQYPAENFHWPVTTQERLFLDSTQEREGSMSGFYVWHTQPQHPQLQTFHTETHGPAMYLPTPPMGTNSLPDPSPCFPLEDQRKRPPWRRNQKLKLKSPNPPAASGPPPGCATQKPASHPYVPPGFAMSNPAGQARETRQQESQVEGSTSRETSTHCSSQFMEGQVQPVAHVPWEGNNTADITPCPPEAQEKEVSVFSPDRQSHLTNPPTPSTLPNPLPMSKHALPQVKEPTPTVRSATSPASARESYGQDQPGGISKINDTQSMDESFLMWLGLPAIDEIAVPDSREQELYQHLVPIQDRQDQFSDISWEGGGLIKTPFGVYLPETFNPDSYVSESLAGCC